MPPSLRLIGRYGNGIAATIFALFALVVAARGHVAVALFCLLAAGLAGFNVYLAEKAAKATSEEERLQAEARKAALQHKMVSVASDTPESVVRQHGL